MNTNRRLFILFPQQEVEGYTTVYKHTFPNDEPPYIMVTYWGIGVKNHDYIDDEEESISYYTIRTSDVKDFIKMQNEHQRDKESLYLEGIMTRNAGEHTLSPREYISSALDSWCRPPKVKFIREDIIV